MPRYEARKKSILFEVSIRIQWSSATEMFVYRSRVLALLRDTVYLEDSVAFQSDITKLEFLESKFVLFSIPGLNKYFTLNFGEQCAVFFRSNEAI